MDANVLIAVKILFIVVALAPFALVVRYRWIEVPLRRMEIESALSAAFTRGDKTARAAAQKALDDNPYVSDPRKTFRQVHDVRRYVLPLVALSVISASSTYIGYSWIGSWLAPSSSNAAAATTDSPTKTSVPTTAGPPERLPTVIIMAIAGGLVWALYQIIYRARAGELTPADLYEINLGLLAAVPIGYAFSLVTQELEGVRSFMAFAASAFPLRDVSRLVRQHATRRMLESTGTQAPRAAERHLGTAIDGVSDEALARLGELRIFTALDMAYSDPVRVMVQTGYPLPVIIDWMDQAIWALYVGGLKGELNTQGIRCSLDVCEFVDLHLRDKDGKKLAVLGAPHQAALDALAAKLGTTSELVRDLFFRICSDPQVVILRELWYTGGVPPDLKAQ